MSIERPGTVAAEHEKSSAVQKIEELEGVKKQLALMRDSLRMEKQTSEAGLFEQKRALDEAVVASDAMVAEGTDDSRKRLSVAEHTKTLAEEWSTAQAELPSVAPGEEPQGALEEKLRSLGVNTATSKYTGIPGVLQAIAFRDSELDTQIRETKLKISGGKEEMALEAIQRSDALSENHLKKVGETLKNLTKVPAYQPTAADIVESLGLKSLEVKWYPGEVQKSVAWRMLQSALPQVGEARLAETKQKLDQLRLEIESLI
ncbi:MAG: hypothetical protein JWL82_254 [Parcubacteria group bacterium]|nr:hypothetical protein [Parcubacteria group bacterium]